MKSDRYVLILGHVCKWEDKEPFVKSGKSVRGAIEFRRVNQREEIRCHECGLWFRHVGQHLRVAHPLSAAEYKVKNGLLLSTALAIPEIVEQRAKCMRKTIRRGNSHNISEWFKENGGLSSTSQRRAIVSRSRDKDEYRNAVGMCAAQLIKRLKQIAIELGRTPTSKDVGSIQSAANRRGISMPELQRMAGLEPAKVVYSPEALTEAMRDFYVLNQRLPSDKDYRSAALPSASAYRRCFGSLSAAYRAVGLALKVDPMDMVKHGAGGILSPLPVAVGRVRE